MNNNVIISGFTTNREVSTGNTAQQDFNKYGKISLKFTVFIKPVKLTGMKKPQSVIGVDVAGFSSFAKYYLKPTNENQKESNKIFSERFFKGFDNMVTLQEYIN